MDSWDGFKYHNEEMFNVYDEKFLAIPNSVITNKKINLNEKFILSMVLSYIRSDLEFYASNTFLSKLLGLSVRTISTSIKNLHDLGYVNVFKKIDPNTRQIIGRTIEPIGKYSVGFINRNSIYIYKKINYDGTDFKQTDISDINE